MIKAIWRDTVIAESNQTIIVEGNHYFPPESIQQAHFVPTSRTSVCFWKGKANYYDIVVGDNINRAAAWYYPDPKRAAENIRNYVAFWNGVTIQEF